MAGKQGPRTREKQLRVNRMIRVPQVRVIGPEGDQLGVLETRDALRMANEEFGLDLLEISPTAKPPVCRIMDHGKWKYEQKKKAQEARKNQNVILVKEIKLRPGTDAHDFDFKLKHITRFLEEGNKAKITIRFRGREMAHTELGKQMLDRILEALGDTIAIELAPKLEGRQMIMVLAPKAV